MKKILSIFYAPAILGVIVLVFNLFFSTPAGVDNFYHIKHAWIYRTGGIFNSDFPWLQYSAIGKFNADIWYGFHLLLIPFTYFSDLVSGLRLVTILLALGMLWLYYFVLKKLEIHWPLFWTVLFFFSVPDVNFRLVMARPHTLTLALAVLLFYALIKNSRARFIFLISAATAFFHLALAWLPVLIAVLVSTTKKIVGESLAIKKVFWVVAGAITGWIMRPQPWGALKLAYIQVVELVIEKFKGTPLRFGVELNPGNHPSVVIHEILPITIVFILALVGLALILKRKNKLLNQNKVAIYSGLAISFIFGLLTYFTARRSADVWAAFTFIAVGLILAILLEEYKNYKKISAIVMLAILAAMSANTLWFVNGYFKKQPPPETFKAPAGWLQKNSTPGDIVFNMHWDEFPLLFYWNHYNYYINGMDPIFGYAFDKKLYLEQYFFEIDKILLVNSAGYTCSANPCVQSAVKPVYEVLKNDFKAKYIFLELTRNPKVYKYLDSDKNFKEVFNNGHEIIFQVL